MGMRSISTLVTCLAWLAATAGATAEPPAAERIRELTAQHAEEALLLFREFLAQPNDARHPADILRLVAWMEPVFQARGFETRRLATAGSPLLLATRPVPGAQRTVLVYRVAHAREVGDILVRPKPALGPGREIA